jgi:hypothetical protein
MKKIILLIAVIVCALTAFSQEPSSDSSLFKVNVGLVGALPIKGLKTTTTHAIGILGRIVCSPTDNFSYILTTGYISNVGKSGKENITHVPALAGVQFNIGTKFYAGFSVGASLYNKGGKAKFSYSPSVGINIKNVSIGWILIESMIDHTTPNLGISGASLYYHF